MFFYKIDDEVVLKLVEKKDAEKIFQLTEKYRDYLREWLPWVDYTNKLEDTMDFVRASLKGYAENRNLNAVVLYKGETVGIAGYNNIDWANKIASIGYWLGEDFQGKGIMTRAVKALTDYAFQELKLNRVEIRAATDNIKSRSIPERLNFVEEGLIRQAERLYNRYVDHVIYGILADEWKKLDDVNE